MKPLLRWLAGVLLVWLVIALAMIWQGPRTATMDGPEYAVVLGAAVAGDQPTPVFAARIDHAIDLWRRGAVGRIVFTGGTGENDLLSEAEVGRRRALAAGVPSHSILSESQSRTTLQNLVFARQVVGRSNVLIVSDPLHMTRAMEMAEDMDWGAAPSPVPNSAYRSWRTKLPFALRELYFLHHYWLLGE